MKAIVALLATAIVIALSIALTPLEISARIEASDISAGPGIFIYKEDGNYPMYHWVNTDCENPIIYTDEGYATIRVKITMPSQVYVPAAQGTIMYAGGYLTSVSYKASWKKNQTITVYEGSSKSGVSFNLTNIPYGKQYIQVSASCVVLLFENGFSSTYPVPQSNTQSVTFTVAPVPTPTPTVTPTLPTLFSPNLEQTIIITVAVIIAVSVVAVAFYKIQHKREARND